MSRNHERPLPQSPRPSLGLGLTGAMLLCTLAAASAQQPPGQPAPATPGHEAVSSETPAAPPTAAPNDGLLGTVGRWVGGSIERLRAPWKGKSEASSAAPETTAGIGNLSKSKVVSGHERCEVAANGAPDCRGAIEALCRSKGLAPGNSLNIESVQKCSARAWLSGHRPSASECRTESYVQSAVCR